LTLTLFELARLRAELDDEEKAEFDAVWEKIVQDEINREILRKL